MLGPSLQQEHYSEDLMRISYTLNNKNRQKDRKADKQRKDKTKNK